MGQVPKVNKSLFSSGLSAKTCFRSVREIEIPVAELNMCLQVLFCFVVLLCCDEYLALYVVVSH